MRNTIYGNDAYFKIDLPTMAMTAGRNTNLGLCHSMAMPLCGMFGILHGQAVGLAFLLLKANL